MTTILPRKAKEKVKEIEAKAEEGKEKKAEERARKTRSKGGVLRLVLLRTVPPLLRVPPRGATETRPLQFGK